MNSSSHGIFFNCEKCPRGGSFDVGFGSPAALSFLNVAGAPRYVRTAFFYLDFFPADELKSTHGLQLKGQDMRFAKGLPMAP